MEIQVMKLSELRPAEYNPRKDLTPEDGEFQKIVRSIQEFGLVEPIIWNRQTGHIVSGHQRIKALRETGVTETEVVVLDCGLREEKILNITLNRTKGKWDNDKLADLLRELSEAGGVEFTGFDEWELQGLIDRYDQLSGILDYDPPGESGGDEGDDGEADDPEPGTFDLTFQIPIEYEDDINLFMQSVEAPEAELAAAVVNYIRLGV